MPKTSKSILEQLLDKEQWNAAEKMIRQELKDDPECHWLWTQLGSVLYEQRKYKASLKPLLHSFKLLPDCPFTLWHLAGTYDAIGEYKKAITIYAWLLRSTVNSKSDPCWESETWTNSLKTDCVYRIGRVLEHQKNWDTAAEYYREYINLQLAGMRGMYSISDVVARLDAMNKKRSVNGSLSVRRAFSASLRRTRALQGKQSNQHIAKLIAG